MDQSHTTIRTPSARQPRQDGVRSRAAILREAASLATVVGIEGLSLGRLAKEVGMSKSGIYAHFGSKEELQLATIEVAEDILVEEVMDPAREAEPGVPRLLALADLYNKHVRDSIFPGGCFLASAVTELDTRPGPVQDRAFLTMERWSGMLAAEAEAAKRLGQIDKSTDPGQLAFELGAFLFMGNTQFVARGNPAALESARLAVANRLAAAAPSKGKKR